jgi:peptide/nickel transport system substrate-binding protein
VAAVAEPLFYYNLESGKLEPWLAESGDYSSDGRVVTIKIRNGVKWSDGRPFTAEDVAFTITMLKANPGLQYAGDMENWVESVEAPDANTIIIKLKKPNFRFLLTYFGVEIWSTILIAPKHIWKDVDPKTFTNYDLEKGLPMGTGPYKLVRSTETETVFDRLGNWWAADTGFHAMPEPERVIWVGVGTEDTRAAMAVNNELDATWIMSRSTYEIAKQRNSDIVGWTDDLPYAYLDACPRLLTFNNLKAPFDNKVVRHAINDAINRDQIAAIAYEGMTEANYSLFPTYSALTGFLERNKDSLDKVHSNPGETDSALQGLGYTKNAEGLWADGSGKTLAVEILSRSGETDKMKTGPVIVAQLRAAGFDASFRPLESAVYFNDLSMGTGGAFLSDICGSVRDPYASFALLHSNQSGAIGTASPGTLGARFANTEMDRTIEKMATLPAEDPGFAEAADQAQAIFAEELPVIPLVQARLLTPFNNKYWINWPTAKNNYIQPGHWWVSGNQIIINVKPANAN